MATSMATSKSIDWDVCERCVEESGIGIRLPTGGKCWAHADDSDLDAALKRLGEDGRVDARGVPVTTELLQRLLAAVPKDERGHVVLTDPRFDRAVFHGDAVFDTATFRGTAVFQEAAFQDAAQFLGATFASDATFGMATFRGVAWFSQANFHRRRVPRGDVPGPRSVRRCDFPARRRV